MLYVGKATNLKNRVKSYFMGKRTPRPIEEMIHEVKNIKHKTTGSVLEAIILESLYIKKYQPRYNILGRDDKSWNYIVITDDKYPQVTTVREHELHNVIASKVKQSPDDKIATSPRQSVAPRNNKNFFGPYPGLKTKEVLKILRRLFKFSTCKPHQKRPCLYRQMSDCLGVCTGEITAADYKTKVIRPLILFLSGKKSQVIKNLERAMKKSAQNQEFEEAGRLRNQISALRRLEDMALIGEDFYSETKKPPKNGYRIEGYDISNISGTSAVGSMVVFTNGEPDKNQYRKFRIRTITQANDVGMLKEILERRFKNSWTLPQLILIDGGLGQVNIARQVLHENNLSIPVVGLAKGAERKKNELIGSLPPGIDLKTLISVRDEAHRFAINYHRKLRSVI